MPITAAYGLCRIYAQSRCSTQDTGNSFLFANPHSTSEIEKGRQRLTGTANESGVVRFVIACYSLPINNLNNGVSVARFNRLIQIKLVIT